MEELSAESRPSVFEFVDYRAFLKAYYSDRKARQSGFSIRVWSRRLGLKSPATLNMILRGLRHPGAEVTDRLCLYFGFSSSERLFFETAVRLARSNKDSVRREAYLIRLCELHPERKVRLLDYDSFLAVANWFYFAIREMVSLPDFSPEPVQIAKKLGGRITPLQARQAFETLLRIGMIRRGSKGKFEKSDGQVCTHSAASGVAFRQYHGQILAIAADTLQSTARELREFRASTFNLRERDLPALKKELVSRIDELFAKYECSAAIPPISYVRSYFH